MTHVTVGARTSDPLLRRRELYLKSYLDSLLLAIRNHYLGRNGQPPQGSPSACVYMDSTGCRPNSPCKALGFIPFQGPRLHTLQVRVFSNHVGVTTIERPDQGHLYPLGEPRDTCHSRGANLGRPAPQARTLPKELSRQLIAGYSEPLLGGQRPAATIYSYRQLAYAS